MNSPRFSVVAAKTRERENKRENKRVNTLNNDYLISSERIAAFCNAEANSRATLPRRPEFYLGEYAEFLRPYCSRMYLCANASKFSYGLVQYAAGNVLSKI